MPGDVWKSSQSHWSGPIYLKLALANMIADPIMTHVISFRPFLFDGVDCDAACSQFCCRSVAMGVVAVCRCPAISSKPMQRGHASLPLWKKAPNSASVALAQEKFAHDLTQDMDCPVDLYGPLGAAGLLVKKKYPAARGRPLTTDKYDASLLTVRIISLAVNCTVATGWDAQ